MSCLRWLKLERGKQTQTGCNCLVNILWQYVEVLGLGGADFWKRSEGGLLVEKHKSFSVRDFWGIDFLF